MKNGSLVILTGIAVSMLGGLVSGTSAEEEPPVLQKPPPRPAAAEGESGESVNLLAPDEMTVALAVDTLSRKLSVAKDDIIVVHMSSVEWPDTSLGCPQPGLHYAQVLTPGSLVLLQSDNKAYRVHVGAGRALVCERPYRGVVQRPPQALSGLPIELLGQAAREDLAKRLDVPLEEIAVEETESVTWPDSSLGCQTPGGEYLPISVHGLRLTLSYGRQQFRYHSDRRRVLPCPAIERE